MAKVRKPAPQLSLPGQSTLLRHRRRGWSGAANQEELAALRAAFDGPEGPVGWECVHSAKFRSDDGHYVICRVEPPGTQPFYADLARGRTGAVYEFQNDSLELTEDQWKRLYMRPGCDWFELEGEKENASD